MAKNYARENVPLSRFSVLVAQLESIVASATHKPPDALLCFDLLSELVTAIDEEPKDSIHLGQRKCEDALYSLLVRGARRPVRHLASVAMAKIIKKGDPISIYSRASTLQGFLSDGKKNEPAKVAGAAQCLGELYRHFGRRITSGLLETATIVTKLLKFNEDFVRQGALNMLQNALEGSGGNASASAYTEAYRVIMRLAVGDKSFTVRIAAARCLTAFASIGGPGLGVGELDSSASYCVKALEDPILSVRDAFAEALGSVLALGLNPEAQVQPRGKVQFTPKKMEGGIQRHLVLPFTKASGPREKEIRVGLTLSWVFLLQAMRLRYLHPDTELEHFTLQAMELLRSDNAVDAQALACVLYILRVGVVDQMSEPTQRSFLVFLGKQLESSDASPSMKVAALRTLSHALTTLGEVPLEFKEVLDNTLVAALSHSSSLVRVEAALSLRALAEVDPTCVGGLISYGVTTLSALRESVSYGKGSNLRSELDSLHGQATLLAALVSISPKLPLGYPTRLPSSVLEVSKSMLTKSSRNPMADIVKKEAGWLLLSSLLASMPMEELEDQVFDILSLWAELLTGNAENQITQTEDITSTIRLWTAAIDALTAFIGCFITSNAVNRGLLLQPVLLYLSRALSFISMVAAKEQLNLKSALDMLIIRTLLAYMSVSDPEAFKSDHHLLLQICTAPFRDPSGCEESSCLRILLDKRDACLGPWIPGRDLVQDELRAFQGGKDGALPCVWASQISSFPQPETVSKMLVNQKLLFFGTIFASQDNGGMLSILGMIEQCLKAGKKQSWHAASVTNICVGLLAGLKALIALRPQPLGSEILSSAQTIFLSILAEGDISASQRRAASEGLGLLARFGNDIFTARLTRLLLGDVSGAADAFYAGSIAFALGCIHRSAGGMALSTLVPATVNSLSSMAKSSVPGLQIWSLYGLLLTIEAAGLSYVSQVQATLGLAMDILLSEENGWVDLQQGIGRLINAIVAVLGPELAPGSIFFSRCKSVVAEISRRQETATLLESVRFTQQLVLFAPQAVSVHCHVQTLLPTLSSRQPALRHLAVTTLRHLIEKDAGSVIDEQIEDTLFHMLDEETDTEIGNLVRATIMRLLYASCPSCPSHWLSICRSMVLATSSGRDSRTANVGSESLSASDETRSNFGDDDETMVSGSKGSSYKGFVSDLTSVNAGREKHLRYRTRVFAAECLSHIPEAVGKDPPHFDPSLARKQSTDGVTATDWLVLHVQELISLAYQTSTIQFENMRPIGVELLSTIMDKFERVQDPDLPGHLLLEQYQAQLLSAVRTALDASSGPVLLEAGLQLATKILTNGITSGDQAAVKRIFSLISRPLNNFEDLYYPSFAEWVSCKIKIRLLTAHASLKCYTYSFLRKKDAGVSEEYLAQLPLFSESSSLLGKYWISILKDYCYICFRLQSTQNWRSFLDGIQSPLVSGKLRSCLEEAWPVIFQAVALDAVPVHFKSKRSSNSDEQIKNTFISGYSMVQLEKEEFQFLWGFALLVLFQGQDLDLSKNLISLSFARARFGGESPVEDMDSIPLKLYEIVLPVFQFLSMEAFFSMEFLTLDICMELLQVFSYCTWLEDTWDSLAISVISQIVKNCPADFLENENFAMLVMELCLAYLQKVLQRNPTTFSGNLSWEDTCTAVAKTLITRLVTERQLKSTLIFLLNGYKYIGGASNELSFSKANDFVQCASTSLQKHVDDKSSLGSDGIFYLKTTIGACVQAIASLTKDCTESMHLLTDKRSNTWKLLQMKLAFSLKHLLLLAELAYRTVLLEENEEDNAIFFAIILNCCRCFQTVLTDTNMQVLLEISLRLNGDGFGKPPEFLAYISLIWAMVQSIVLQVLKSNAQRSTMSESNCFLLFFIGELLRDFFFSVNKMLKIQIQGEAVSIVIDFLKLLVILQTLSKESECQKGFMDLFLDAIVMIFSSSDDNSHQGLNDLRSTAGKLVSQLAQIPSSAVHLKEVLLAMPVTSRQLLQGILRTSVTQEQKAVRINTNTPSLVIKLPVVKEETSREKSASTSNLTELSRKKSEDDLATSSVPIKLSENANELHADNRSEEEEHDDDEDDDDDWDTFQSFPASTGETVSIPKTNSDLTDHSSNVERDPDLDQGNLKGHNEPTDNHQKEREQTLASLYNEQTVNAEPVEIMDELTEREKTSTGQQDLQTLEAVHDPNNLKKTEVIIGDPNVEDNRSPSKDPIPIPSSVEAVHDSENIKKSEDLTSTNSSIKANESASKDSSSNPLHVEAVHDSENLKKTEDLMSTKSYIEANESASKNSNSSPLHVEAVPVSENLKKTENLTSTNSNSEAHDKGSKDLSSSPLHVEAVPVSENLKKTEDLTSTKSNIEANESASKDSSSSPLHVEAVNDSENLKKTEDLTSTNSNIEANEGTSKDSSSSSLHVEAVHVSDNFKKANESASKDSCSSPLHVEAVHDSENLKKIEDLASTKSNMIAGESASKGSSRGENNNEKGETINVETNESASKGLGSSKGENNNEKTEIINVEANESGASKGLGSSEGGNNDQKVEMVNLEANESASKGSVYRKDEKSDVKI